ncbi:hypothetical protein BpsM61_00002 [Bacillus phage vB_BpsM-61]|nr:hypothetical protein BpsM61_00002 [Bacillus phage vB_BpsM-61]
MIKLNEQAIFYDIPGSYSIRLMEKEIEKQQRNILRCKKDIEVYPHRPDLVNKWEDQIDVHQKRIDDCERTIRILKQEF